MDGQRLRSELQQGQSDDMRRRRAIIGLSVAGMASMSGVSLLQTGLIAHLPDLPLPGFNAARVSSSDLAYRWGVPDGTLAAMGCALNLPIAAWGGQNRAREQPLVPLLAAAKAALDAGIAARYLYEMPSRRRAWCSYCIVAALVDFAVFGLTLPEARKALTALRNG